MFFVLFLFFLHLHEIVNGLYFYCSLIRFDIGNLSIEELSTYVSKYVYRYFEYSSVIVIGVEVSAFYECFLFIHHFCFWFQEKYLMANIRTAMMLFVVTLVFILAFLPSWLLALGVRNTLSSSQSEDCGSFKLYLCVYLSVCPAFTAYISISTSRI